MADRDRNLKVIQLLIDSTKKGNLEWELEDSSSRRSRFIASLENASVVIFSRDGDGSHPYVLNFFNENGELVESLRTIMGRNILFGNQMTVTSDAINLLLANLYDAARRAAMNTDAFLDGLIGQLEQESDEAP